MILLLLQLLLRFGVQGGRIDSDIDVEQFGAASSKEIVVVVVILIAEVVIAAIVAVIVVVTGRIAIDILSSRQSRRRAALRAALRATPTANTHRPPAPVLLQPRQNVHHEPHAENPPIPPNLDRPPHLLHQLPLLPLPLLLLLPHQPLAHKDQTAPQNGTKRLQELIPPIALGGLQDLVGHVQKGEESIDAPAGLEGVAPFGDGEVGSPVGFVVEGHEGAGGGLDGRGGVVGGVEGLAEGGQVGHGVLRDLRRDDAGLGFDIGSVLSEIGRRNEEKFK
mmetsp:Transcript_17518/g.35136  ORF Transcript_17518/g.35136 Transcript_17518/m.35136 type:complete len:278 (+) Transcript_17518:231-1064(+)